MRSKKKSAFCFCSEETTSVGMLISVAPTPYYTCFQLYISKQMAWNLSTHDYPTFILGVSIMIAIFGDFRQFSAQKLRFL
jgi:hypothetical protein